MRLERGLNMNLSARVIAMMIGSIIRVALFYTFFCDKMERWLEHKKGESRQN